MYQDFYRLNHQPFANTPDTEVFYPGGNRAAVLDALLYAINRGEALLKVVGEVGCGKTMLCRMLDSRLTPDVDVLYLSNPNLTPHNIFYALALEMGLDVATQTNKVQLQHHIHVHLLQRHAQQRRVVLLVEEAQCMPLATLEEIRMLSNLETREQKLLQIVLFGQPELEAKLAQRNARQLTERIAHSFYLAPFTPTEVHDYVVFRLARRSESLLPELFSPASLRLLSWASNGLARRINFIADKALLAAFSDHSANVTLSHVLRAVKDCDFGVRWLKRRKQVMSIAGCMVLVAGVLVHQAHFKTSVQSYTEQDIEELYVPSLGKVAALPTQLNKVERADLALSPTVSATPIPKATVKTDEITNIAERTRVRMKGHRSGKYTLQLLTSRINRPAEAARLAALIHSPYATRWKNQLLLHEGHLKGERVMVASLGDYASYAEASKAAKHIPEMLNQHQPFVRTLSSLRQEVGITP